MSVRERVEDARFLLSQDRRNGALLSLCSAVSATSRKRYPEAVCKADRKAFTTFMGDETPVLWAGVSNFITRVPGANLKYYPDEMMPMQDVLYEYIRCELAHEATIAKSIKFLDGGQLSIAVENDQLVLGGGVIRRLFMVVEFAPENWAEFPEVADLPMDVASWALFGPRRQSMSDYMLARQKRLDGLRTRPA